MSSTPTQTPERERILDAWIQHPSPAFVRDEMFATLRRWMRLDTVPDHIPLQMTLGAMDSAGVERAVLTAWWGPRGPLLSNDEVAGHLRSHPERFIGVCAVDLHRPMDTVRELRRCVKDLGFRGLRLLPWLWGLPPNDRRYYPLYAECIELGVPFCLQVGHAGPLKPSEPGRPIPYLDEVCAEFPELTVIGGHIGHPWTAEMVALATKYPNVYIDTSAYKPSRYPPELVRFLQGRGHRKVLFGSNHPMIMPGQCVRELDQLELTAEARAAFLWGNAAKLFSVASC